MYSERKEMAVDNGARYSHILKKYEEY